MESNIIDSVNVLDICIRIHPMAFECEIIFWIYGIHLKIKYGKFVQYNSILLTQYCCWMHFAYVLYRNTTFDAA